MDAADVDAVIVAHVVHHGAGEGDVVVAGPPVARVLQGADPILGGAATCSEGFVIYSLKVPLACLGSMAAAV